MKKKMIVFQPALAPYRLDLFNFLSDFFSLQLFFESKNVSNQKFNQEYLVNQLKEKPIYLIGFNFLGKAFRFNVISKIINIKPDIILSPEFGFTTISCLLFKFLFNSKIKLYIFNDDSIDNANNKKSFQKIIRYLVLKNIDGVLLNSNKMCNWYSENISTKIPLFELPIIHNELVFRNKFKNSLIISKKNSTNFNLEKDKIILYVGRLDPEKNIEFLIRAFFKMNLKNTKLIIVGNGKLDTHLKSLTNSLKLDEKIIFTGRLDGLELVSWYNLSNVFVLPSIHEPYGAVVNEALILGSNVLCSKFAGASALITTDNGLIFDPKNEIEFIKKLKILLNKSSNINNKNLSLRISLMPFTFKSKLNVIANNL